MLHRTVSIPGSREGEDDGRACGRAGAGCELSCVIAKCEVPSVVTRALREKGGVAQPTTGLELLGR